MKCETCRVCGFKLDKYGRCPDVARAKQEYKEAAVRTLLADEEFIAKLGTPYIQAVVQKALRNAAGIESPSATARRQEPPMKEEKK